MSDMYRNQPDPNEFYGQQDYSGNQDPWNDPAYPQDDYAAGGYMAGNAAGEDPFSAWRRPADTGFDAGFLQEEPYMMGAEMQQGGLPLYEAEAAGNDFRAMGDAAPTRIGAPVQMVSKRVSQREDVPAGFARPAQPVQEEPAAAYAPAAAAPAPSGDAAPRRRSRRMERRDESQAEPQMNEAVQMPVSQEAPRQMEQRPYRRTAMPGDNFSGPRTAMPSQRGPVADRAREVRDDVMASQAEENWQQRPASSQGRGRVADRAREVRDDVMAQREEAPVQRREQRPMPPRQPMPQRRPMQPEEGQPYPMQDRPEGMPARQPRPEGMPARRPASQQPARRPMPQGEGQTRYPQMPAYGQEEQGYGYPQEQGDYAARRPSPYNRGEKAASVPRKPYDFEEDDYDDDEPRKGGALVTIIVVLLLLGGILAGIVLPDWEKIGGPVGETLAPAKNVVVSTFNTLKNKIIPEEELVTSFSANCAETEAPATVHFTVQTSKNAAGIRIVDDYQNEVYSAEYNDELALSGEVMVNSNALIWKPSCVIEDEYYGGFTVYVQRKDGTESEGTTSTELMSIAPAKEAAQPMQGFTTSLESGSVPAEVTFTLTTSDQVSAVRVVDQYESAVATMSVSDEDSAAGTMTQEGEVRTWKLNVTIENIYNGSYRAQYQTEDELNFASSDFTVPASFMPALPVTDAPADTPLPEAEDEPLAGDEGEVEPLTDDGEDLQPEDGMENQELIIEETPAPTNTPEPTATPVPTPTPTLAPDATPLPDLEAAAHESADPTRGSLGLKTSKNNNGKSASSYVREEKKQISILTPFTTSSSLDNYAAWMQAGILTFRGGPMRQNASFKTVEVEEGKLSVLWSQPVGSMKVKDGTVYGVVAPGQPLIVKWAHKMRPALGLNDDAKATTALKEVIVAGQDGKVYFYDLITGNATRDPIDLGAPSAGGLSLATNGAPVLGVGQSHKMLNKKTVDCGYHFIDLLTNKETLLVRTDGDKERNSSYSGVLGAALFDKKTGTAIFGTQGGALYTVELGDQKQTFTFKTDPETKDLMDAKVSLQSSYQTYLSNASDQKKKYTNIDASVAMYDNYVYFGDRYGLLQCVDINTMSPVWVVDTEDKIDSTPALDLESDGSLAIYTGNTYYRRYKSSVCNLRKLDAMTGEILWTYDVPDLTYNPDYEVGLVASPVVGQESISDLMIYTVTNGKHGSSVLALNKADGSLVWRTDFAGEGFSSPVAVYNENGDAWILQGLGDGNIVLMKAKTGEVIDTLNLEGAEITASPAVYGNLMVIGTTGKENSAVYCIKIQ